MAENPVANYDNYRVETVGIGSVPSPLRLSPKYGEGTPSFVADTTRILVNVEVSEDGQCVSAESFEKAGPRSHILFSPAETKVAILTAGGLCPGLNNVIRSAFLELYHNYGVREIFGIRYGFAGLDPNNGFSPLRLSEETVDAIHNDGGTVLG